MNYSIKIATISILSLAFLGAASASNDQIEVKFVFDGNQSAELIYEDLRQQAIKTCKKDSAAMKLHRIYAQSCVNRLLQSVTESIGRGDIARTHNTRMARSNITREFVVTPPRVQAEFIEQ